MERAAAQLAMVAVILRRADPLFSRILVGTDGSDRAAAAVRQGARLAALTGAELEIAHVYERSPVPVFPGWRGDPAERTADILAGAARMAAFASDATTLALAGHAPGALAAEAVKRFCDLVCVGADASFLEKPHLFGGVAVHSLHQDDVSVLVARATSDVDAFPTRILCAVDGSPGAQEAARQAVLLGKLAGAMVRMLTVTADRPAPAIVRAAGEWRADLVVVGSPGRRGLSRVMSGSVGEWVASQAPCSVLVARPRPR